MHSRDHRGWLALLAGVLLAAACDGAGGGSGTAETASATRWKPSAPVNLVLVLIDTLRADAILDPQGRYDTPNIDRLARDGVLFPRAFASAPMTLPSHASILTGLYPFEHGVRENSGYTLRPDVPTLAEAERIIVEKLAPHIVSHDQRTLEQVVVDALTARGIFFNMMEGLKQFN